MAIKAQAGTGPVTPAGLLRAAASLGLERLEAQWLLLHALGQLPAQRSWLAAHERDALAPEQGPAVAYAQALFARRASGEPLAYLLGQQAFFGLDFQVDRRVLIPRADTELLVRWALELLPALGSNPRVLDLGTGSGAVALAILKNAPQAKVSALDASLDALAVARANAQRLDLPVALLHSDWLAGVSEKFDLLVSNPPYIASGDGHLPALAHEPAQALVAGPDGLADLRQISAQAPRGLHSGGWLLLEHGFEQAHAVSALLLQHGFAHVQTRCDLAGRPRCTGGQWNG